ncbi:MAG: helix-turn-helix domain-containing protein [Methyloligellaceae bacterium]
MAEHIENGGVKKPNPIDIHVGSRLRLRRMMLGISQEKLGDRLGLTFQQIQKYEKGTNRIGASRLFTLAQVLDVNVQFFFDEFVSSGENGANGDSAQPEKESYVLEFLNSREGLELNRAFVQIPDQKVRRKLIELVRAMAQEEADSR